MKRRPALWLFIFAFLGAVFGFEFYHGSWLIYALLPLPFIPLIRVKILSIFGILVFTFFITALSASHKNREFLATVENLPSKETTFYGEVLDVSKKRDGSIILLARLKSQEQSSSFNGKIRLKAAVANKKVVPGQEILLKAQAKANLLPLSSVHFDAYRYGLAHDLHANLVIKDPAKFWAGEIKSKQYFQSLRFSFIKQALSAATPHESSLLLALMIGDTALFSEEQRDIYQGLGIEHLLAVSGLQVTLLSGIVFFLLIPFFILVLPRTLAHRASALSALLALLITFWFVGLCGFSSSALRAFLMSAILLLPHFWARKIDVFDAFFASGFVSLLLWPESVLDLGFLLSYSAVFALLVAHERSQGLRDYLTLRSRLLSFIVMLFISTVAAFLGTLPIIALYFHRVAPFSIIANLIMVPAATFLQIPAISLGLLGSILHQNWLIKWAIFPANLIEVLSQVLYESFGKIVFLPPFSSWVLFLAFSALACLFLCLLKRNIYLGLTSFLLLSPALIETALKPQVLEVVLIPVGQGDSTLFSTASGEHFLIDAGGLVFGDFDPGKSIILPTLKRRGIKDLDVLIITHPDNDHILGAFALIEEMPIKEIWHSGFLPTHPLTMRLKKVAKEKNIPIKEGKEILGSHYWGDLKLDVLSPNHHEKAYFEELSSNNNSLVIQISYGHHKLLWPGDVESVGEKMLLDTRADLKSQILKAPHHGSKTSSTEEFIEAVNPKVVLYSTGVNNRFHFPHEEVVKRYQAKNIKEYNTAVEGEITIKLSKDKMFIESFRPSSNKKTGYYHQG